jgi:hypothetical protein
MDFKGLAVALKNCPGKSPVLLEFTDERESCVLSMSELYVGDAGGVREILAKVLSSEAFEVA